MEERTSSIPAIIFLVFLLTIEISFTYSIWLNLYIVCVVMVYLTFKKRFSIMFFYLRCLLSQQLPHFGQFIFKEVVYQMHGFY